MDEDTVKVFLPDPEDCYQRLRRARFGATVSCVYCDESEPVIKKGTTGKGAQQYRCKECETYFNDLTGTIFEHRKFPIEEITLSEVCEADEIYVTAGEKGIEKEDVDEEIAELGDGSVILCTDDYTIYDDIDEYDGIDAHLAITHDDAYVIGDAHVNSCENRHSFIRQWLAKFRGVSKHYLQGYLDFSSL